MDAKHIVLSSNVVTSWLVFFVYRYIYDKFSWRSHPQFLREVANKQTMKQTKKRLIKHNLLGTSNNSIANISQPVWKTDDKDTAAVKYFMTKKNVGLAKIFNNGVPLAVTQYDSVTQCIAYAWYSAITFMSSSKFFCPLEVNLDPSTIPWLPGYSQLYRRITSVVGKWESRQNVPKKCDLSIRYDIPSI